MRRIIHGQIYSTNFSKLEQLAKDYSSCVRFCFVRFQKDKLKFNDVRNLAKQKYKTLNTRQISDATTEAQGLATRHKENKVIFGGKKLWEHLSGEVFLQELIVGSDCDNNLGSGRTTLQSSKFLQLC